MRGAIGLGLAGLLAAVAAVAVLVWPAAPPIDFDCEAGAGSYSDLSQVQPGPAYRVRGTIVAREFRDHERWVSSAQALLENGDRSRWIAVALVPEEAERANFVVRMQNGEETPHVITLGSVGLDQAVPFDLSLSGSGEAVAVLGGQRRVFRLDPGRNLKVSVSCSTGKFRFTGLDLDG